MRALLIAVLGASLLGAPMAHAGSSATPVTRYSIEDAADFSKQIERDLAANGARLAIVFRSGEPRDELPDGIRYTHGGFWVHSQIEADDGRTVNGYAVHNLYHDEEDRSQSYLEQDWPLDFTRGDALGEVGIIIPSPEMQSRILAMIQDGRYAALHHDQYALLSNPHDLRYQNCTEFMLDVIAAAAWQSHDRPQLKANLAAYFEPAPIELTVFQRLFGPSVDDRLRINDHHGLIRTASYSSIADFMLTYELASDVYDLDAAFLDDGEDHFFTD
jgi:hypothetical protein